MQRFISLIKIGIATKPNPNTANIGLIKEIELHDGSENNHGPASG